MLLLDQKNNGDILKGVDGLSQHGSKWPNATCVSLVSLIR